MYLLENLNDINNCYTKIIRNIGNENSLTFEQSKFLISIPYDGILLTELAFRLGIDNSTLTRNIQKLNQKNLIEIKNDFYDKRKKILSLSSKGNRILNKIENKIDSVLIKLNDQLDVDEMQEINNALEKLNWSLSCINNE